MPEGELSGLRDRVTKLEFDLTQKSSLKDLQDESDKVLAKAAANDRERNDVLLKLIDERLGAHRSAMLTEMERDHTKFRTEAQQMLKDVVKEEVPDAVRAEVRAIEAEKELEKQKALAKQKAEEDEREKKWLKVRLRFATAGTVVLFITAVVGLYFAFQGESEPRQVHHLGKVSDALTNIQ